MPDLRSVFATLGIGMLGAGLASLVHLPVPGLIGSSLAVSLASFRGLPMHIPVPLRNLAYAVIGCSLASGVTPDIVRMVASWPLSLGALACAMALIMIVNMYVLMRFFGTDRQTALLASSPGALSYSLALSATGIGDARSVMVLQGLRLLFVTAGLPLVIATLDADPLAGVVPGHAPQMGAISSVWLVVLTLALGAGLAKYRLPAAYLIAGMLLSGFAHAFGWAHGRLPEPAILMGFVVTGSLVGARFSGMSLAEVRRLALGSVCTVALVSAIAAVFAALVARWIEVPFGQVWVAYAPGGVEAMAAMALALDYDATFVAVHHLFRIILLLVWLPLILRWMGHRAA